jgi:acyl dehydratase
VALRTFSTLAELEAAVGEVVGPSDWVLLDQPLIERFAKDTGDHNWVHVDQERAAQSSFGTTIAHGFLTLSLIGKFSPELIELVELPTTINYGLDRVRFPAPCPSGSRVRATAQVMSVELINDDAAQLMLRYRFELEGSEKPVCVADQLSRRSR